MNTLRGVTGIIFFMIASPIFVLGLIVGFLWDMFRSGFYWGVKFMDWTLND